MIIRAHSPFVIRTHRRNTVGRSRGQIEFVFVVRSASDFGFKIQSRSSQRDLAGITLIPQYRVSRKEYFFWFNLQYFSLSWDSITTEGMCREELCHAHGCLSWWCLRRLSFCKRSNFINGFFSCQWIFFFLSYGFPTINRLSSLSTVAWIISHT